MTEDSCCRVLALWKQDFSRNHSRRPEWSKHLSPRKGPPNPFALALRIRLGSRSSACLMSRLAERCTLFVEVPEPGWPEAPGTPTVTVPIFATRPVIEKRRPTGGQ